MVAAPSIISVLRIGGICKYVFMSVKNLHKEELDNILDS